MQKDFEELITKYKALSLETKKNSIIHEIKEMLAVYIIYAENNNIPINILKTEEILDIKKEEYDDEDFFEALYAYFNILKEVVSNIILEKN